MAVRSLRLNDIAQLHSVFSKWSGRFEQLSCGRFDASLQVLQGKLVRAIAIEANQRVLLRGSDSAARVAVHAVSEKNASSWWRGNKLSPGDFVVQGGDSETDHCSGRRTAVQGFSIEHEQLENVARVLLARSDVVAPRAWRILKPSPDQSAELQQSLNRLVTECAATPTLLGTPEGERLEEECLRRLVEVLYGSSTSELNLSLPGRTRLLRRAEEVLRSRLHEPIGVVDLCREVEASDRTLRLAFRERYGLGPMAYEKCLRLNAVRSQLKASPLLPIADVARQFGFHHLGNFAADYRRLFGELPSTTDRTCR